MSDQLSQALNHLRDVLRQEAHEHCVSVTVFFNSEGYDLTYTVRNPNSLKRDSINMRNLRGEWV